MMTEFLQKINGAATTTVPVAIDNSEELKKIKAKLEEALEIINKILK
jgi:hypothetical protein